MKSYSVKEIADLLNTNPETVRRWIRSGKLCAVQESRKEGNTVSETELDRFLKKTPKYAAIAEKSFATVPMIGIPLALRSILGAMTLDHLEDQKSLERAYIRLRDVTEYLNESIAQHENNIRAKQEAIAHLEQEIAAEEQQIRSLQATKRIIKQESEGNHE